MAELSEKAIQEIVRLARAGSLPITIAGGNTPVAVIPSDMKVVSLAEFVHNDRSERPLRKAGTVKVLDGESFERSCPERIAMRGSTKLLAIMP